MQARIMAVVVASSSLVWSIALHAGTCDGSYWISGNVSTYAASFYPTIDSNQQSLSSADGACMRSNTLTSTSTASDSYGTADAFASAGLSIGHLGAYADASGSANPNGAATAEAGASGKFFDTFVVTSSTYANGTAVPFLLSDSLTVAFVGEGGGEAETWVELWDGDPSQSGYYDILGYHDTGNISSSNYAGAPLDWSQQLYLNVGQTYYIEGFLHIDSDAGPPDGSYADEQVLATHSAAFSLTSQDPNASYTTASGCALDGNACDESGTPAVPEPSSLLLIASGMIGLVARLRRHR